MGFLQLWRQYQISHEVKRGAQRASRVVLGTSGLRACGEGVQFPFSFSRARLEQVWKFQGEVACGAEEREEMVQAARSHWQEQASAPKGKPSCPRAGALGGHSLSFQGPGSPP